MTTEAFVLGDPSTHMAFQLNDTMNRPLVAQALNITCKCGQLVATIGGISLDVNVPEGQDLLGRCRCGKEWSVTGQGIVMKARMQAMQEAAAKAGEQALQATSAAPTEPTESVEAPPIAPEVPAGEDPQAYNKSL